MSAFTLSVTVLLPTDAALAHDGLVDASPAADTVVIAAPTEIKLTFNNQVLDIEGGVALELKDASGNVVAADPPRIERNTVTQQITAENMPAGVYSVTWRVVSSDAHPIDGKYFFGVGDVTEAQVAAASAAADEADPEDLTISDGEPQVSSDEEGISTTQIVLIVSAVVAALAALTIIAIYVTGKKRKNAIPGSQPADI